MKKKAFVIFCLLLAFCLVGCGKKNKKRSSNNQIKCVKTASEGGTDVSVDAVATFDRFDVVADVTLTYDFGSEGRANMYCTMFKSSGSQVSCSGTQVIIRNLESFEESEDRESSKLVGKSKKEFIKAAEEDGFNCD